MLVDFDREPRRVYKIECGDIHRYVIYNASVIGNPPGYAPDKWYFQLYPVPLGLEPGEPFDTAGDAEQAARQWHALVKDDRILN